MKNSIPDYEIEAIVRLLLPDIQTFYENGGREALEKAKQALAEEQERQERSE